MTTTFNLKDLSGFLKRYPIGVACGVLTVAGLVGYFIRSNRAEELNAQLKDVETQADRILGDVHNSVDLGAQYTTLTAATNEMESRLVRGSERARNQQYFYELESDAGVREISLQPSGMDSKQPAGNFCSRIGYTITVEGNFGQILGFVKRLETGRYFCRLISASATRKGTSKTPGSASLIGLTLNLELLGMP